MYDGCFLQTGYSRIPNVPVDRKTRLSIYFKIRGSAFETLGQAFETLSQAFETLGRAFEGLR